MTTPTGTISMTNIQTEFGGTNPINLTEYYAGGAYVPAGTAGVPSSGTISMDNLRGKSKFVPVTVTVTPSSQTEGSWFTISITATQLIYYTLYWKITDLTNLQTADFNVTSGVIYYDTEFGSGYAAESFRPIQDSSYEGSGTFKITVYSDASMTQQVGQSGLVTVTDLYSIGTSYTSRSTIYRYANLKPEYRASVASMLTSGLEGATIYYEVICTNGYSITSADLDAPTSLTGTQIVPVGGVVQTTIRSTEWDGNVDITVDKVISVRWRLNNASGAILATSPGVTLWRKPVPSFSFSPSTVREGYGSTLSGTVLYIPYDNAVSFFWTATGTANPSTDWYNGGPSGEYPWNAETQSGTILSAIDTATETNETLTFTWKLNSTTGTAFWAHTLTIESPAQIITATATATSVQIDNVHTYPVSRDFSILWRARPSGTSTYGTWNTAISGSNLTVPADWTGAPAVYYTSDAYNNNANFDYEIQLSNSNYATYTITRSNSYQTFPVYALVMTVTGANQNGATRGVFAQITSTPTYPLQRNFDIQYSIANAGQNNWSAWASGFSTTVNVLANTTSSVSTQIRPNTVATAAYDVRLRTNLAGQEIRESTTYYNVWL